MFDMLTIVMGAIIAAGAAYFAGRRGGKLTERDRISSERMQDDANRMEAGRDAVRNGRGRDPADRLRDNDGRW